METAPKELKEWERHPSEPVEKYMQRLYKLSDGYNTFADMIKYQPQAINRMKRYLPELIEKLEKLQDELNKVHTNE